MKVLLVRFSAIGDCAMAAHTATCIRRSSPEAHLTWAVEERCAPVVDEARLVSRRAVYPRERWKQGAWTPRVWREQWQFYRSLRAEQFDFGLDLQGHSKTAICLRLSGARKRLSLRATDGFARRLNPVFTDYGGVVHTVDRQLAALRSLGNFAGDPVPPILPEYAALRAAMREKLVGRPTATIAVGAGQPAKAYPAEQWAAVARALLDEGFRVVFIGGPEESAPPVANAEDWVGRLILDETMALIAESAVVLAADTGAGHLAAGYGVPTVSIFGPTDPAEFRPYGPHSVVLQRGNRTRDVPASEVIAAAKEAARPCGS